MSKYFLFDRAHPVAGLEEWSEYGFCKAGWENIFFH